MLTESMIKKIGNDEFCLHCMEWREYDEEGRCKVCKHVICKVKKVEQDGYNKYHSESPSFETDEEEMESDDY